jgi:hypothetical protein
LKYSFLCLLSFACTPSAETFSAATARDSAFTFYEEDSKIAYCFNICAPTAPIDRENFDLELDLRVILDISQSSNVYRCEDIFVTRSTTSGAQLGDSVATPLDERSTLCEVRRDPTDGVILWRLDEAPDTCEAGIQLNPLDWVYPENTHTSPSSTLFRLSDLSFRIMKPPRTTRRPYDPAIHTQRDGADLL